MRNDYVGPEPKRSIAAAELFNLFACCYLQVLWDLPCPPAPSTPSCLPPFPPLHVCHVSGNFNAALLMFALFALVSLFCFFRGRVPVSSSFGFSTRRNMFPLVFEQVARGGGSTLPPVMVI